ncbi:MAG: hypothetical protein R3E39_30675 [Anaerolineae bacterium]
MEDSGFIGIHKGFEGKQKAGAFRGSSHYTDATSLSKSDRRIRRKLAFQASSFGMCGVNFAAAAFPEKWGITVPNSALYF